jgi:arylsulfatase A-like enzyme
MNTTLISKGLVGVTLAAMATVPRLCWAETVDTRRPNVLVILVDDLGYGEPGCYGGKDIPTPNIDAFAAAGVRFTDGYVGAPWCAPSRAALLTGCYPQRWGCYTNETKPILPVGTPTIANHFLAAGYTTGMTGKWHVSKEDLKPDKAGFTELGDWFNGPQTTYVRKDGQYSTEKFTNTAMSFIEKHQAQQWMYYLPYNAVHTLLHVAPGYENRFTEIKDEKRRQFATMLTSLDVNIGRLMNRLTELKLDQNTLVFIISDNGGYTVNTSKNDPLRGTKGQLFEGGIRVPFMVRWSGHLQAGTTSNLPVITHDVLPTALAAAGIAAPPSNQCDGVNLLPYLDGTAKGTPHDALYWELDETGAVRQGQWKWLRDKKGKGALYDLKADVGETRNLAQEQPAKAQELQALWEKWHALNKPTTKNAK